MFIDFFRCFEIIVSEFSEWVNDEFFYKRGMYQDIELILMVKDGLESCQMNGSLRGF